MKPEKAKKLISLPEDKFIILMEKLGILETGREIGFSVEESVFYLRSTLEKIAKGEMTQLYDKNNRLCDLLDHTELDTKNSE